jgi:hypothetical protein
VSEDGYLKDIVELKAIGREGNRITNIDAEGQTTVLSGAEFVSMNMWAFHPQIFPQLHERFHRFLKLYGNDLNAECYIPDTVNSLIRAGEAQVKVLRSEGAWFGVTYREDQQRVVENIGRLIEQGAYPRRLWQ